MELFNSVYCANCSLFSSSVRGFISSVDSEKLEWPVRAAWACASISDLINFPQLNRKALNNEIQTGDVNKFKLKVFQLNDSSVF